ncbi:hypothetical protein [Tenacibaculum sp. M341]|uniref:hypothetical protein n=1 Tax=Tenacibaculum sp. M341 TaxID=2530339 RepID=UPI0014054B4D|nr:hypothetical protein [Tenacibaculum sp. M341]
MGLITKRKKRHRVRIKTNKFLILPIIHRGRLHWLSKVKLEKAFNGYRMMIIGIEPA